MVQAVKKRVQYPWDKWLKRKRLTLRKGVNFNCRVDTMAQQFRNQCFERGIPVSIHIDNDTLTITLGEKK